MTNEIRLKAGSIRKVEVGSLEEILCLALPQKIYTKERLMQSAREFQMQLAGKHPLSKTYTFEAWLLCGAEGQPLMRAALTFPHNRPQVAYVGYFESVSRDEAIMQEFVDFLSQRAQAFNGAKTLLGPVQASFWVSYRMQLSGFSDAPFTGEPHNPDYYPTLWQAAGFELTEQYVSNFFHQIPQAYRESRLKKRYEMFRKRGLRFVSPKREQWQEVLPEVFDLLSDLYREFPLYDAISFEQFAEVFNDYQQILDFSMVQLAYQEECLVGFVITVPDYGPLPYQAMTALNILKLLKRRRKARRYTIMYLGVERKYLGLGSALSYLIYQAIEARSAYAVAGLIHQGKVTQNYASDLKAYQHHYGIFEKKLSD